jgi:outer membrane protein
MKSILLSHSKILFITLSFVFLTFSATSFADSLIRVYELAQKYDYQMQQAKSKYLADTELSTIARAKLYPTITADYQYRATTDNSAIRQLVTTSNGGLLEADVLLENDINNRGWSIRLEQPLFDAPAWYGYQQSKNENLIVAAEFEQAKQDLLLRVLNAYLNVLRAQDNIALVRAQEQAFSNQLQKTKQRFDSGLIPITELTISQAAYDVVTVDTIEAENSVEVALEALTNLTGQDHHIINLLHDNFIITRPEPDNISKWEEVAAIDNIELLISEKTSAAIKQEYKAAKWQHSPKVTLGLFASSIDTGGRSISSVETPFVISPDQNIDSLGIEVRLEIPIYSGGSTSANIRRVEYQFQGSKDLVSGTARKIRSQVRQLFLKVKSDIKQVKSRRSSILSAKNALDAVEAGFEIGTSNITEILYAQNALFNAEREYSSSRYNYIENSFRLRAVSGSLNSGDIYRLDAFLKPPSDQQIIQRSIR